MRSFETVGVVFRDGFVPERDLRRKHGRKIYFAERNFAPTWGKRPEYNLNKRKKDIDQRDVL